MRHQRVVLASLLSTTWTPAALRLPAGKRGASKHFDPPALHRTSRHSRSHCPVTAGNAARTRFPHQLPRGYAHRIEHRATRTPPRQSANPQSSGTELRGAITAAATSYWPGRRASGPGSLARADGCPLLACAWSAFGDGGDTSCWKERRRACCLPNRGPGQWPESRMRRWVRARRRLPLGSTFPGFWRCWV